MLDNKKYTVASYEIGGPDYGEFETFEEAKEYADNLKFDLREDFSIIKYDDDEEWGEEIYTTKD